jgi:RimJ/RimL family protein N-acetyltransferase
LISYPKSIPENDGLKAWIEQRVPEYKSGASTVCVAVERGGKLVAAVAWDGWRGASIEVTIAADDPRWISRQTVTSLLAYPFVQLKCQRVTSFVRKGNKRARRLNDGLGFKLEGRLRDAGHNLETVLVYGLTRRDYVAKYITPFLRREPIGQQETAGTAASA